MLYDIPLGKGRHFLPNAGPLVDGILGRWELSVVTLIQTGQFLTPTWTGPDPTGTAFTTSTTPATVTIRPNILRDPNVDPDQRSLNRWFDASAFAPPVRGSFGTSAKGVIVGPGSSVLHVSLAKYIPIRERLRLRAGVERVQYSQSSELGESEHEYHLCSGSDQWDRRQKRYRQHRPAQSSRLHSRRVVTGSGLYLPAIEFCVPFT